MFVAVYIFLALIYIVIFIISYNLQTESIGKLCHCKQLRINTNYFKDGVVINNIIRKPSLYSPSTCFAVVAKKQCNSKIYILLIFEKGAGFCTAVF